MTTFTEQTETTPASTAAEPKATKKPRVGARVAPVATKKPKSGKKATPAKKTPKSANKASGARDGSKAAKILDLLKRPGGAHEGASKGQRLAAPFRARVPLRDRWQEDGPERCFQQGGRRGAKLFGQERDHSFLRLRAAGFISGGVSRLGGSLILPTSRIAPGTARRCRDSPRAVAFDPQSPGSSVRSPNP